MMEVLREAVAFVNLPFTVLLGLVVVYWLLVALGALDTDFGGGGELDAHADAALDGAEPHGHVDLHGTAGALEKDADGADDGEGLFATIAQFANVGEVPLMVVLSVLSLSLWTGSMVANHYVTGQHPLWALVLLVPNLAVSIVLTRYLTMPLRPVFRLLRRDGDATPSFVGQPCRITSRACAAFGQAEIARDGAPLLIHVRTLDGGELPKGATAVVVREDRENEIYFVAPVAPLPDLDTLAPSRPASVSAVDRAVAVERN